MLFLGQTIQRLNIVTDKETAVSGDSPLDHCAPNTAHLHIVLYAVRHLKCKNADPLTSAVGVELEGCQMDNNCEQAGLCPVVTPRSHKKGYCLPFLHFLLLLAPTR
jgi:hypothetical protein